MDSSSSQKNLSQLFEQLGEWRRKIRETNKRDPLKFKWSEFHLSVIHGYVLKLNLTPDSSLMSLANLLNQQFSNSTLENYAELNDKVASLMHALHEIFVVPQQHQLFERDEAVEKNGLLAAFMDVLLRLLHRRPRSDRIDSLRKELRFFLAVLGDESFICSENLLAEFEAVANKAGSLIHLIIFSTKTVDDKLFGALLRRMGHLIVMDDLWSSDAWSDLQACFPDNGNRSRILFTSRNKNVAPPDSKIYELPLMSDGHCWELLRKKVFRDEPCPPHLQNIGEKIATSCHGVPLAVVVIAELLKLWIAEGFICKEDGKRAESVAEKYLKELIDRSLVSVAKKTLVDKNYSINKKHQRLCIRGFESSPRSPLFGLHVRSIFGCFPVSGFLNMKLLRVLVLQGVVCHGSLNEIKLLTNLRCLAIGYGSSSSQPEALKLAFISTLVNLEFLQLKSQFYLVYTPSAMAKMMKLRHINVNTQVCFGAECSTSSQQPINNLEFLYKVIIRDLNNENMLKCSPNLRGIKCKCFPFKAEETGKLRYPDFSFFTHLESLHLEAGFTNTIADISLPSNLKELTLSGLYLPWEKISEIGRLQNLQNLKLLFDAFDGEVWETREGEFEQLRFLTLKSVYDLKEWKVESRHHFPRLRWLVLDDCLHLPEIPAAVGEIATLEVVEIKGHSQESLQESARQIQEQQREEGNEELNFNLHNTIASTSQTASSFFSFLLN